DDARRGAAGTLGRDFGPHPGGDLAEQLCVRRAWFGNGHGTALVGGPADLQAQRHLAEKLGAEPGGFAPGAAMREDFTTLAAMWTEEIAHILDDPENRHVDLLKHRKPAARVDERDVLRRRDDDGAGERHLLRHGQ